MEDLIDSVLEIIEKRKKGKERLFIAIDGRCAAGKTTLAEKLQERLEANVFHMDDFFLRPEQRTVKRLAKPGGNVDYERFLKEVMQPLKRGEAFFFRPYDCHRQVFSEAVFAEPCLLNIIEGSYACHPVLWDCYHVRIFLTLEKEEQLCRIRERNGEDMLRIFRDKWIPLEERYFEYFQIEKRCDVSYRNSERKR